MWFESPRCSAPQPGRAVCGIRVVRGERRPGGRHGAVSPPVL